MKVGTLLPLNALAGLAVAAVLAFGATPVGAAAAPPDTTVPAPPVDPAATAAPVDPAAVPTTTLPAVPAGVFNPTCARVIQPGESISLLADQLGTTIGALLDENGLNRSSTLHPGQVLDVCVGNEVNDLNGASRARPTTSLIGDANPENVKLQQQKLNELFGPYGMAPLTVDGASGRLTRQQLCAARVLLGLPISRSDMAQGSDEEARLFAMTGVPIPPNAPTSGDRWALIDMTCQVMFLGEGTTGVRFVFPTSTGGDGFATSVVGSSRATRFNPALANGGWHDSSEFPAAYDNPLNGNMYKPIYFNGGEAIHGANNVPPSPASKGCARLSVNNQDQVVAWLGLGDATDVVWSEGRINLTVTAQGGFLPDP